MNRREVLRGMLALSALGSVRAFPLDLGQYTYPSRSAPGAKKLAIILQGPFGVVIHNYESRGVTAFVPKTSKDDGVHHEFRFLGPNEKPIESGAATYHMRLQPRGLHVRKNPVTIDRAFDDVRFSVNKWVADPDDYFVMLDLPRPDNITFIPPVNPAIFESGLPQATRFGSAPLTQVLEYTVQDADDINVVLPARNTGNAKGTPPLSFEEMLKRYEAYEQATPDQAETPSLSQRPLLRSWMAQYSYLYFFGVGAHPHMEGGPPPSLAEHGVRFFNNRLLPAIYQNQKAPKGSNLVRIGKAVLDCTTQSELPASGVRPTVWDPSRQHAHLLMVSSSENCTSPGTVGTANQG